MSRFLEGFGDSGNQGINPNDKGSILSNRDKYMSDKIALEESKRKTNKQLQEGDLELTIKRIIKAPLIYLRFMGLSENQARIIYFSLIGVGGYFAYKKFKK